MYNHCRGQFLVKWDNLYVLSRFCSLSLWVFPSSRQQPSAWQWPDGTWARTPATWSLTCPEQAPRSPTLATQKLILFCNGHRRPGFAYLCKLPGWGKYHYLHFFIGWFAGAYPIRTSQTARVRWVRQNESLARCCDLLCWGAEGWSPGDSIMISGLSSWTLTGHDIHSAVDTVHHHTWYQHLAWWDAIIEKNVNLLIANPFTSAKNASVALPR